MKLKKIVTNDIKKCHPNQNPCQTDQYYQRLANRLQDGFCSLGKIIEERTAEVIHRGAIMLANYMEDIVADSGQWRAFSNLCQKLYGHPVIEDLHAFKGYIALLCIIAENVITLFYCPDHILIAGKPDIDGLILYVE